MACACAAGLSRSDFFEKIRTQRERWQNEIASIQNVAYLAHFSVSSARQKASGSLEIYYVRPDTVLLFSPGFLGKGSLRGRWILGKNILVYFPRENSFFEGGWEDFLLGRKAQTAGLDSLIFNVLSRSALLPSPDSIGLVLQRSSWSITEDLGRWKRQFIFSQRGKLAMVKWQAISQSFELEVEIDRNAYDELSPRKVEWNYPEEKAFARFEMERAAVNMPIPAAKSHFAVPEDAKRLERMNTNETD